MPCDICQCASRLLLRRCDEVGRINMDLHAVRADLSPVYVPVFVFSSWRHGVKLRTFVSGITTAASGTRVYDDRKIALLAAGCLTLFWALTSPVDVLSSAFWFWYVLLPAAAAGWVTRKAPALLDAFRRWSAVRQRAAAGAAAPGAAPYESWDTSWVNAYSRFEEQYRRQDEEYEAQQQARKAGSWRRQRQRQQQREQQQQRAWGYPGQDSVGRDARDPQGYYKELGVQPNCSKQELQAAFRGMALRYHPDTAKTEPEKKVATAKFQRLSQAYNVLRDDRRRRLYDETGQG